MSTILYIMLFNGRSHVILTLILMLTFRSTLYIILLNWQSHLTLYLYLYFLYVLNYVLHYILCYMTPRRHDMITSVPSLHVGAILYIRLFEFRSNVALKSVLILYISATPYIILIDSRSPLRHFASNYVLCICAILYICYLTQEIMMHLCQYLHITSLHSLVYSLMLEVMSHFI